MTDYVTQNNLSLSQMFFKILITYLQLAATYCLLECSRNPDDRCAKLKRPELLFASFIFKLLSQNPIMFIISFV